LNRNDYNCDLSGISNSFHPSCAHRLGWGKE